MGRRPIPQGREAPFRRPAQSERLLRVGGGCRRRGSVRGDCCGGPGPHTVRRWSAKRPETANTAPQGPTVNALVNRRLQSQPTAPNHPSVDFARRGLGVRFPSSPLAQHPALPAISPQSAVRRRGPGSPQSAKVRKHVRATTPATCPTGRPRRPGRRRTGRRSGPGSWPPRHAPTSAAPLDVGPGLDRQRGSGVPQLVRREPGFRDGAGGGVEPSRTGPQGRRCAVASAAHRKPGPPRPPTPRSRPPLGADGKCWWSLVIPIDPGRVLGQGRHPIVAVGTWRRCDAKKCSPLGQWRHEPQTCTGQSCGSRVRWPADKRPPRPPCGAVAAPRPCRAW